MSYPKAKGKLTIYWAASCGGCEISILGSTPRSRRGRSLRRGDVALRRRRQGPRRGEDARRRDRPVPFNGGTAPASRIHGGVLRRKSKVLVAFGSCATEGCIPGLGNMNTRQEIFDTVYRRLGHTGEPPDSPAARNEVPEGTLHLPVFYDTLKTLGQTVNVDYYLPGCPPEAENIWAASWPFWKASCRRRAR